MNVTGPVSDHSAGKFTGTWWTWEMNVLHETSSTRNNMKLSLAVLLQFFSDSHPFACCWGGKLLRALVGSAFSEANANEPGYLLGYLRRLVSLVFIYVAFLYLCTITAVLLRCASDLRSCIILYRRSLRSILFNPFLQTCSLLHLYSKSLIRRLL